MEAKFLVSLLILGLISTSLAKGGGKHHDHDHDRHHGGRHGDGGKKCPQLTPSSDLPMKCTVSDDCNTISCSGKVEGETFTLSLKFDTSKDSAEISLKVPSLDFEWSHTFKNGEKIKVPDFPLSIKGIADGDMYLVFDMFTGEWGFGFKLHLSYTSNEDIPLLEGKMPHDHKGWSKCHRFASWFKRQSKPVKASIIISAILVFVLVVCAITYCCKKRRGAKKLEVKPPSYDEAITSTETKVPMKPLINEE